MRYDQKYRNYTMPRLILENYLRERPLRMKDLCPYAGHDYGSLRVAKSALRRAGRLSKTDEVDLSHPENLAMSLVPLGDMQILPAPYTKQNEAKAKVAREMAAKAIDAPVGSAEVQDLTEEQLKRILSSFIQAGGGGKDFIGAINSYRDMIGNSAPPGPPAPLTEEETIDRIVRVLQSAAPHLSAEAIARFTSPRPVPPPEPGCTDTPETTEGPPEASSSVPEA